VVIQTSIPVVIQTSIMEPASITTPAGDITAVIVHPTGRHITGRRHIGLRQQADRLEADRLEADLRVAADLATCLQDDSGGSAIS
jgi:hypothetical protein